jgi:hypothetical protein
MGRAPSPVRNAPNEAAGEFFVLESPLKACTTTTCSGDYWVRELDGARGDLQVSALDVSGVPRTALAQALGAESGEVVLRGQFGPAPSGANVSAFIALEVWRGLPGVNPASSDSYSSIEKANGQLVANVLDGTEKATLETLSLSAFVPLDVDMAWLGARVLEHGALVAGRLNGTALEAEQVFIRLPDVIGPCPDYQIDCRDEAPTYSRDDNRCLIPTGCVVAQDCPLDVDCRAGYRAVLWRVQPAGCASFACDPAFLSQ